jgi:hypothetical protein
VEARASAARLLGTVSKSPLARTIYSYLAKSPEEMFTTGRGSRLVSRLSSAVADGASPAALQVAFKNLPYSVASSLTSARSPADVSALLADAVRGNAPEDLYAAKARLAQVQSMLSSNERLTSMGLSTVDDIYSLMGERAMLEERLNARVDPALEAPMNLPVNSALGRIVRNAATNPLERFLASVVTGGVPLPVTAKIGTTDADLALNEVRTLRAAQGRLYSQALDAAGIPASEQPTLGEYASDQMNPLRPAVAAAGGRAAGLLRRADAMVADVAAAEAKAATYDRAAQANIALRSPDLTEAERLAFQAEAEEAGMLRWRRSSTAFSRFWDQVHSTQVPDHTAPNASADAKATGIQNLTRFLNRLGVRPVVRDRVLDLYASATKEDEVYRAMEETGRAVRTSPLLDPREANQMATFFGNRYENERITGSVVTGEGMSRNLVPTVYERSPDGIPLYMASGPEELMGGFRLPNYDDVVQATSYWRRILQNAGVDVSEKVGAGGRKLGGKMLVPQKLAQVYKVGAHTLQASTRAFKTAIILPRSIPIGYFVGLGNKGPSTFALRTIGAQVLRVLANDIPYSLADPTDIASLAKRFEDIPGLTSDSPVELMGAISNSLESEVRASTRGNFMWHGAVTGQPDLGIYDAASQYAALRSSAPDMRMFGQGYELGNVQSWARGPLGKAWHEAMTPIIERFRKTLESERGSPVSFADARDTLLANRKLQFDQTFGWDPEVARSISTGYGGKALDAEAQAEVARMDAKLSDLRAAYDDSWANGTKAESDRIYQEMKALGTLRTETEATVGGDRAKVGTPAYAEWFRTKAEAAYREGRPGPVGAVPGWLPSSRKVSVNSVRQFTNWAYENWITSRDIKYARGPAFMGVLARERERLSSLGWSGAELENRATLNAAARVRDIMFDLGSHSATGHFFRNIVPFGSAWANELANWGWHIPAEMYPGVGQVYLAKRIQALAGTLQLLGVDLGTKTTIPGLGDLVKMLTGGPVPISAQFNPLGASILTEGGALVPGLGPLPQLALNAITSRTHNHVAQAIDTALTPYGPTPGIGPANLTRLYEGLVGKVPPWVEMWGASQDYAWQSAVDTGTAEQYRGGRDIGGKFFYQTQPKESSYSQDQAGIAKFQSDYAAWLHRLGAAGERSAQKYALASFVLSAASPANIYITDPVYQEYQALRAAIGNVPSASRSAYFDELAREYPHSQLYGAPRTVLRPDAAMAAAQSKTASTYRQFLGQLDTGARTAMSAEDFARNGLFLTSYHHLQAQRTQLLSEMAAGKGAAGVLDNWYSYSDALAALDRGWSNYTMFHKAEDGNLQAYFASLPNDAAHPNLTIAQERLFTLMGTLRDALPTLAQEDGVRPQAYKDIRTLITQTIDKLNTQYGPARSPIEAALTNWFDTQAGPYFAAADKIYRQIDATAKADRGPLYDQLRALADNAKPYTDAQGNVYPTPEAWSYNAKSPAEQTLARLKWASNQLEWLTEFQRSTITGEPPSPAARTFFDLVNATQARLKAEQAKQTGTGSTARKDAIAQFYQSFLNQKAAQLGMTNEWNLAQQAPFERLATLKFFPDDPTFYNVVGDIRSIWNTIQSAPGNPVPGGSSALATYYQNIVYSQLDALRRQYPDTFGRDMSLLEQATAPAGANLRAGADMYRAIFFNNWFV